MAGAGVWTLFPFFSFMFLSPSFSSQRFFEKFYFTFTIFFFSGGLLRQKLILFVRAYEFKAGRVTMYKTVTTEYFSPFLFHFDSAAFSFVASSVFDAGGTTSPPTD